MKKINIIGSGFSSLAGACYLAQAGFEVNVLKKRPDRGRARLFETNGFKFDMGPSWYWMPDVFERFLTTSANKLRIITNWCGFLRRTRYFLKTLLSLISQAV